MKATKAIASKALCWLDEQRLAPTPGNYRLSFEAHGGAHRELSTAVASRTDGGIRLSQTEADELSERFFGRASQTASTLVAQDTSSVIRHQTLRLADLTASVSATTGEFSRELEIYGPEIGTADSGYLQELVASTLARSRRTEEALAATTTEVEQLRLKLETVQGDAERDQLTGLPNRRGIDANLAKAQASKGPVSLAICDIDRFKSYNDRYGHAVGDRVLKTVATTLTDELSGHFVGRWGGEEFLLILNAEVQQAVQLIEVAKEALGSRHFKLRETDEPLGRMTFSSGVVPLPADDTQLAGALARADALLYQAKNAGRDRVLAE